MELEDELETNNKKAAYTSKLPSLNWQGGVID